MLKIAPEQAVHGFLKIDIGLLGADDKHAVFSVRVPRSYLAKNHHFLNTISELAAVDAPPLEALRRPDRWHKWKLTAAVLIAAILPSALWDMIGTATATQQQPLHILSATALNPQVQAGGELIVDIVARRLRICPTIVQRSLVRASDNVSVESESSPTVSSVPTQGAETVRVAVHIPEYLKPGRYIHKATLVSACGGDAYAIRQPDIPFEVVADEGLRGAVDR